MKNKLLFLIFLLALVTRFWQLGSYPEAVDEDEMALGYYAYSLVKNGSDEFGNKFPIYFESVGDYKYGLYSYVSAIPVGLFGLNPVSARSVAALAGALSVVAIYYLSLEIFKKQKYALFSSFVLAVSSTHIHFSRVAYNNILGSLFAIVSVTLFLKWVRKKESKTGVLSFFAFILSIFSYQTFRIFLPITFVLLGVVFWKKADRKFRGKLFGFLLIAFAAVFISLIPAKSRARTQGFVNLANTPKIVESIAEDGLSGSSILETRVFHNKAVSFVWESAGRYLSYFDPLFLFLETSKTSDRHGIPGMGLFYPVELVLSVLGLMTIFLLFKDEKKWIPLILLLASPVAASLVVGVRSTTRSVIMIYSFTLFIAAGLYWMHERVKNKKVFVFGVGILYFLNLLFFRHQYLIHKVYHHPWNGDVGLKEMVEVYNENKGDYEAFVVSGGHYIPFLFYNSVDPKEFIANSTFAERALDKGARVERFDDIFFNMPYDCPQAGKTDVLYVCFGYKVPKNAKVVDVVRFRDGQPAVFFVEFGEGAKNQKIPDKLEYNEDVDERFKEGILPENYDYFWPEKI